MSEIQWINDLHESPQIWNYVIHFFLKSHKYDIMLFIYFLKRYKNCIPSKRFKLINLTIYVKSYLIFVSYYIIEVKKHNNKVLLGSWFDSRNILHIKYIYKDLLLYWKVYNNNIYKSNIEK